MRVGSFNGLTEIQICQYGAKLSFLEGLRHLSDKTGDGLRHWQM